MERLEWKKEIANTVTHGIGMLLSVIGAIVLLFFAMRDGDPAHIGAIAIYSVSLVLLYLASTLYHGSKPGRYKKILQVVDHICIFLLIGGSYTPFIFIYLNRSVGWTFLAILWSLIVLGSILKIIFFDRFDFISTFFYLLLGWMAVFIIEPMIHSMPVITLLLIAAGGFFYTLGILFYLWEKYTYHHAIWHLFVLAGSFCHYWAIFYCVS